MSKQYAPSVELFIYYKEQIDFYFGRRINRTIKDVTLCKNMLSEYSLSECKNLIDQTCKKWSSIKDDFNIISTYPTMAIIFGFRMSFFDYFTKSRKTRSSVEYKRPNTTDSESGSKLIG
jgi:hypothetical protein